MLSQNNVNVQLPNILIVDDTSENIVLLKKILRNAPLNILSAETGEEAIEICKGKNISLALIDVMLPDMLGFELAKHLNQNSTDEYVPVIFLTAFQSNEAQILKGFDAGAVDYIVKPFNQKVLLSKVNVFVELYKQKQLNQKQQYNLEKALEIGNVGTWELDIETRNMTWTEQNYKNLGIPANLNLHYEEYLKLVNVDDRTLVTEAWKKALSGDAYDIEYRIQNGSGFKWVRDKANVIAGDDGLPVRAIGFTQDITERKLAEEKLREKEAFNYAVFQINPIPAILVDSDGRITDYNMAQKNFSTKAMSIGKIMYREYASSHKNDMYAELLNCIRNNKHKSFPEIKYKNRYLSITMSPVVKGAIITCIDITHKKKAEFKLEKAGRQLELLNKHLVNAREEERARISLAIHDELGQALTALKIDLNSLRANLANTEQCSEKLGKMIVMTNDIIKRVQRISSDLRPGILDDLGLMAAIEWYSQEFEERTGITCKLELVDIQYNKKSLDITLYRIFQEALTNIIRHAQATEVVVKLSQTAKSVTLQVKDNGVGIAREKIKSFKSLGLMGINQRAQQLGGEFKIISKPRQGATMLVTIPK